MKTLSIEFTSNMFGFLPELLKSALYEYLEFAAQDNWNEIYSCVISNIGKTQTLWQAVLAVDPSFASSVSGDELDNVRWSRIPSPVLVAKAINNVVFKNLHLN